MDYDYDVNLRLDSSRGLLELLSFSRLSLINSLVDYRAYATLGLDAGESHWRLDVGTWKGEVAQHGGIARRNQRVAIRAQLELREAARAREGEVDGGTTRSATISFLNPLGEKADVEFSLGIDDSELYGNVTFFSVFLYFYGGT